MPTYEYECPSGHRYETREGFDAPPVQKCIKCRKTARRVLFAPPIVFKGSGFYKTDSRGSEAAGSSSSESTSDAASESKPEAKSETKADSKPGKSENTNGKDATPKTDKATAPS